MDNDVVNTKPEVSPTQNPFRTKFLIAVAMTTTLVVLLAAVGQLQSREDSKNQTVITVTPQLQQTTQTKSYLGVEYIMVNKDEPNSHSTIGAYVSHIIKGSPAEREQLHSDDTIIDIDGEKLSPATRTLGEVLATKKPGQTIKITYVRYDCDPRDKTFLSCSLFIKNVGTVSATLIQMPSSNAYPYFSLLQQLPSLIKNVQWENARPDDYWDSANNVTVTGFSIRGLFKSPDASLEPMFSVLDPMLKEMGWLQNVVTEPFIKKEGGLQQVLTYRIFDETNKVDPTTQKTGRRCPCTISYYIFISFPYAATVTPTFYNRITPTGF